MNKLKYKEVYKDAGLYRQWIVQEYGNVLLHGGQGQVMSKALKHLKRLAKTINHPVVEILKDIQAEVIKFK